MTLAATVLPPTTLTLARLGTLSNAFERMLGHASAAMTLDVNSDLFDDDIDAVADALDQRGRVRMWAHPASDEKAHSSSTRSAQQRRGS
jgi:hypothetical protein